MAADIKLCKIDFFIIGKIFGKFHSHLGHRAKDIDIQFLIVISKNLIFSCRIIGRLIHHKLHLPYPIHRDAVEMLAVLIAAIIGLAMMIEGGLCRGVYIQRRHHIFLSAVDE